MRTPSPLKFGAFTMPTASHIYHGQWRNPTNRQTVPEDLTVWVDLAKILDDTGFDVLFLADAIGLYGDYRGGWSFYVERGLQIPTLDPAALISALVWNTTQLGFAVTSSTLQELPFSFARKLSTLDAISGGRVGWNIVTSAVHGAARNFGADSLPPRDVRYRQADEYLDVLYALWEGSWREDALKRDVSTDRYADPSGVRKIHHRGEYYRVEGPHLVAPTPQRTPTLFQAGASEPGRDFAARHAEVQFLLAPNPRAATETIRDVRRRARGFGRRDEDITFMQGLTLVVGDTEAQARDRNEEINDLLDVEAHLAHLGGLAGVDLGDLDLADPLSAFAEQAPQLGGLLTWAVDASANPEHATVADLVRLHNESTRVVGTPELIADELQGWREAGIGGINVQTVLNPGTFTDLIDHALPVLRARGLMAPVAREPRTLRERLTNSGSRLPDTHPGAARRESEAYEPAAAGD